MKELNNIFGFQGEEIHVWMTFPGEIRDPFLLSCYRDLLSSSERAQYERFYFSGDSHQYLISRALVRCVLSGYTDILPQDLEFPRNDYGRPELKACSESIPWLDFNISHTKGLVICAVALNRTIGADVECNARRTNFSGISGRFFSSQEMEDLSHLPEEKRKYRFFQYWTLKESYIKALGKGLQIPLNRFGFYIGEESPGQISFRSQLGEDDKQWRFFLFNPAEEYTAAISLAGELNPKCRLNIRRIVPLHSMYTCSLPCIASGY